MPRRYKIYIQTMSIFQRVSDGYAYTDIAYKIKGRHVTVHLQRVTPPRYSLLSQPAMFPPDTHMPCLSADAG